MRLFFIIFIFLASTIDLKSQEFYYGADQSYVNEMEDCGVEYKEENVIKDVYQIYKDQGSNLVRLRLWHTPSWYDNLNSGNRYSDLADVKKAISRAKNAGMSVLLDFHLSDEWADPAKQFIPDAWLEVVSDLPSLQDSLYNYIYNTLSSLEADGLLPEMVQIGNETNKGILQTKEQNATWKLEWPRNALLFNAGIKAVRDFEKAEGSEIKIVIHFAGPEDALWLSEQFYDNYVVDFDIIGLSYYWAWHQPTTIARTGDIIESLKADYGKDIMIVETGYIWTNGSNDNANNIISEIDDSYGTASPESQKEWLKDLRDEVASSGGLGMIYWEPSWVSSECFTLWGQGSHQEHATFFDFDNNLLIPGGVEWMSPGIVNTPEVQYLDQLTFRNLIAQQKIEVLLNKVDLPMNFALLDSTGRKVDAGRLNEFSTFIDTRKLLPGTYFVQVSNSNSILKVYQFVKN